MNYCPNCKNKSKTPVKQFDDLIFENWYTDPSNVLHTILVCTKCEHFCDLEGSLNPINWINTKSPMKVNYISKVTFGSLKGEFIESNRIKWHQENIKWENFNGKKCNYS